MNQAASRSVVTDGRQLVVFVTLVAIAGAVMLFGVVDGRNRLRSEFKHKEGTQEEFKQDEFIHKIESSLDQASDVRFENLPLIEVLDTLAELHHIEIKIDKRNVEDAGVSLHEPINLIVTEPSLKSVLKLVLEPMDLTYLVDRDSLLVTTNDVAVLRLRTVHYPI